MAYLENRTEGDYQQGLPHRLEASQLANDQLLHLMMKCIGHRSPDAMLAPVYIADIRRNMAGVVLNILYSDEDLRPLTDKFPSAVVHDMWIPIQAVNLEWSDRRPNTIIREGYFLPYQQDPIDDLLKASEDTHSSNRQLTSV
jgi:hypothetical protein